MLQQRLINNIINMYSSLLKGEQPEFCFVAGRIGLHAEKKQEATKHAL